MHGVLSHTKNKIWGEEKNWGNPPAPRGIDFLRFFLKNSQNWLKWQERFYPHPPPQTRVLKKFCWWRWVAERRVKRAQTREQGPPAAAAVFITDY